VTKISMQRALYVSRQSVDALLRDGGTFHTLESRVYALEKQATLCDALVGWPALAASFRDDAKRLRDKCATYDIPTGEGQ
jgi:hypothetical protein